MDQKFIPKISEDFNFEEVKECKNNIILFGNVGSGKTTLINKLCGKDYIIADNGFSCTRMVQSSQTIRCDNLILDFPGLNSMREIVQHLCQQRDTLKAIPVRMICFVVKYNNRFEDILKSILQMLKIFKHHQKNIAIILTHCENMKCRTRNEADLVNIIEEESGINEKNIVFSSLNTDEASLSLQLNKIKESMVNIEETIIESSEILKQFDLGVSFKYNEISEKFLLTFNEILELHKKEFNNTEEKELKRTLYFSLKDQKDKIVEDFKKELENVLKLEIHQVVSQIILFQNMIYHKFKEFKILSEKSLEIQSVAYNGQMNRFKKCIFCGETWFRVYGCDSITCGRRSISKDNLIGKFAKYTIKIIGKVLKIEKTEINRGSDYKDTELVGLTKEETQKNLTNKIKIAPRGCGKNMKWNEMQDVTEETLDKLKTIEDTDYYSNLDNELKF